VYWCWFLCFVLNAGICLPQAAHAGLDAWSALSGAERAGWLRMLAAAVEAKREPLMQLEAINTGRTINEMGGDLDDTGVFLEYWAEMAEKLDDKQGEQLDAPSGYEITMRYDAAGVAACVLPFNWPLVNVVLKLGPALAAGCCVVLKPSEYTPLTTLAFAKVVQEINFPAGVINVVTGLGSTCGAGLITHPGISVVGFTGSVSTGCRIARDAQEGDHAKHVFAEMGGKSAAIVLDDVGGLTHTR
jgi:betaine-aldehyde dehydrogenase